VSDREVQHQKQMTAMGVDQNIFIQLVCSLATTVIETRWALGSRAISLHVHSICSRCQQKVAVAINEL